MSGVWGQYSKQQKEAAAKPGVWSAYDSTLTQTQQPMEITPSGPVKTDRGDFMAGFASGSYSIPASAGHFLKNLGLSELGENIAKPNDARAAEEAKGRITDWKQVNSLGDVADFLQFTFGSALAQMAPSLGGAAGGAAVGTAVGGPVGTVIGSLIGAALPSYIQNTGQVYQELESLGAGEKKALALALGVPIAALDAITPGDLMNRIVSKQVAKGILKKLGYGAVEEGVTEAIQEGIQHAGTRAIAGQPTTPGLGERMLSAGISGAVGGAGIHALTPSHRDTKEIPLPLPPTPEQVTQRKAEVEAKVKKGEEVKKAKETAVMRKLKIANAWNERDVEERKAKYPGLADADYNKKWSELDGETKTSVTQAYDLLNPPEVPPTAPPPAAPVTPPQDAASAAGVQGGVVSPVQGEQVAPMETPPPGVAPVSERASERPVMPSDIGPPLGPDQQMPDEPESIIATPDKDLVTETPPKNDLPTHIKRITRALLRNEGEKFQRAFDDAIAQGVDKKTLEDSILREIGGDELIDLARKEGGKLGAALDQRAFHSLGANLYSADLAGTIAKEGLQNAVDAVRGRPGGKVKVGFYGRRITFHDNGAGMTPAVMENEFLDIGGSLKPEGATGGLGLAKVALFYNADTISVTSVYEQGGRKYMATMRFSGNDWVNGTIEPPQVEPAGSNEPTGTRVSIIVKSEAKYEEWQAQAFLEKAMRHGVGGVELEVTKDDPPSAGPQRGFRINRDIPKLAGEIFSDEKEGYRLSVQESEEQDESFGSIDIHLLNNGLYQGSINLPFKGEGPKFLVADIKPKVKPENENYPFTASREALKKPLMESMQELVKKLNQLSAQKQINRLIQGLASAPSISGTPFKVFDTSLELPQDFVRELSNRPYMLDLAVLSNDIAQQIAQIAVEHLGEGVTGFGGVVGRSDFDLAGIGLGSSYLGVNISLKNMDDAATAAGVDFNVVRDLMTHSANVILINPYTMASESIERQKQGASIPLEVIWSGRVVGTIIHEIAHQQARGHNEGFAGEQTRLQGAVSRNLSNFYKLIEDYWNTEHDFGTAQIPHGLTSKSTYGQMILHDMKEVEKHGRKDNAFRGVSGHTETTAGRGDGLSEPERNGAAGETNAPTGPADGLQPGSDVRAGETNSTEGARTDPTALPGAEPSNRLARELGPNLAEAARGFKRQFRESTDAKSRYNAIKQLSKMVRAARRKPYVEPTADIPNGMPTAPDATTEPTTGTAPQTPPSGATQPAISEPTTGIPLPGAEGTATQGGITREEFEAGLDAADQAHDDGTITDEEYVTEIRRLTEAHKGTDPIPPPAVAQVQAASGVKMPDTIGKDLNTFEPEQLDNTKKSIGSMLRNPAIANSPTGQLLRQELDRIFDHESKKRSMGEGGFLVLPIGKRRVIQRERKANLSPSEQYFSDKIVLEPEMGNRWNMMKWLRQLYQGGAKQSHAVNSAVRLFEASSGGPRAAHQHAGKMMEMMDGSLTRAEAFLRGKGPFLPDGMGGMTLTGAKSLTSVVETAHGQIERLGWLWAASRALDLAARDKAIGIDLAAAQDIYINAPEWMHQAVREGRQYHLDLSRYGQAGGLIDQDSIDDFSKETAYGPIQRVFDERLIKTLMENIKQGKSVEKILGEQPFKRLKGGDLPIRNMVESTIDVTYRTIRAADLNLMANELVELARQNPALYEGMMRPLEQRYQVAARADMAIRAKAVKAMFAESGIDISNERANLFANMMSDDALSAQGGILRVWNKGELELWQVDELLADSLKSMTHHEFSMFTRFMGAAARPFRLGIVLDPMFVAGQLAIDQMQGWMNTRYGFRPVYDSFRGWWALFHNTEQAQEAIRAGGVERGGLRNRTGLQEVIAGPDTSPAEELVTNIKTLHPVKAINTFLTPIREATRMGEYLRAREHGASPIEAAWAARDLLGNYSMEGTFTTIRALNHMAAFSRPAIAVMEKTARTIKERPAQWFIRGSTMAIGAILLYAANADDEEIRRLRQTPDGQRWMFFRVGGTIYKWRKPYLEGAIFMSATEAALDSYFDKNPQALSLWAKSIQNEVSLNMLPVLGVLTYEVLSGQSWRTGAPIVPGPEEKLAAEYQVGYSGTVERVVGKTFGVSPAIISHVARGLGGYLGQSALMGISAAIDWTLTDEAPPKEDWPFAQRLFAKYPSYGVRPVKEFYENAKKVEEAANTLAYAYEHDQARLPLLFDRYEKEMPLIEIYNDARQQISDLRDAIEDIESIADLGPQSKKVYRDQFLRQIIDITEATNTLTHAMTTSTPQSAKP